MLTRECPAQAAGTELSNEPKCSVVVASTFVHVKLFKSKTFGPNKRNIKECAQSSFNLMGF